MKILIILPNWLGDALMATPAIEHLCTKYPDARLTFVGSFVSIEALKYHPKVDASFVDDTKKEGWRLKNTQTFAQSLGEFDIAISFRNNIFSTLMLVFTPAHVKIARKSWHASWLLDKTAKLSPKDHLSIQYNNLVNLLEETPIEPPSSKLYIDKYDYETPTLGINPGATYGSAKRWYPDKFAEVAKAFSPEYKIIIFGGPGEVEMGNDIEKRLQDMGISNYENLAGKTNIKELCARIGGLDIFVTNDSGPMHVAAAFEVPTVAIFGPTRHLETCQWKNESSSIVRRDDVICAPCMKRTCPLKHHECMTKIEASDVIEEVKKLIN
ncbi:MAG: lipopolysaccharide heptosyltransferase II [Arcobacter sp.]|nr:MAG: lipopolysaccharide heptosyltransferase II [Arcobacter sp.]